MKPPAHYQQISDLLASRELPTNWLDIAMAKGIFYVFLGTPYAVQRFRLVWYTSQVGNLSMPPVATVEPLPPGNLPLPESDWY